MICKLYVNCGEAPDQATCLASMGESAGYSATLNADVASGKVLWDGTMARTCVEALERYYGAGCTQSALATASPPRPSTPRRGAPPDRAGLWREESPWPFRDRCGGSQNWRD